MSEKKMVYFQLKCLIALLVISEFGNSFVIDNFSQGNDIVEEINDYANFPYIKSHFVTLLSDSFIGCQRDVGLEINGGITSEYVKIQFNANQMRLKSSNFISGSLILQYDGTDDSLDLNNKYLTNIYPNGVDLTDKGVSNSFHLSINKGSTYVKIIVKDIAERVCSTIHELDETNEGSVEGSVEDVFILFNAFFPSRDCDFTKIIAIEFSFPFNGNSELALNSIETTNSASKIHFITTTRTLSPSNSPFYYISQSPSNTPYYYYNSQSPSNSPFYYNSQSPSNTPYYYYNSQSPSNTPYYNYGSISPTGSPSTYYDSASATPIYHSGTYSPSKTPFYSESKSPTRSPSPSRSFASNLPILTTIDNFSVPSSLVITTAYHTTPLNYTTFAISSKGASDPSLLGGERDMILLLLSTSSSQPETMISQIQNGIWEVSVPSDSQAIFTLQYDGFDDGSATVNTTGLTSVSLHGVNLEAKGANRMLFEYQSSLSTILYITLYDVFGGYSTYLCPISPNDYNNYTTQEITFSQFLGVAVTNIGAVVISLEGIEGISFNMKEFICTN